jgi:hypothetical protein
MEQETMTSTVQNSDGSNTLTMLQAKRLFIENEQKLTSDMKDFIIAAFALDVKRTLADARRRWMTKEPLTAEQSTLLLDWMRTKIKDDKDESGEAVTKRSPSAETVGEASQIC